MLSLSRMARYGSFSMHQTGKDRKDDSGDGRRHNHSQTLCVNTETERAL